MITGEKIYLRPITEADTPCILRWRNDGAVRSRFVYRETLTEEAHLRWMRERVATGRVFQFIICEHAGIKSAEAGEDASVGRSAAAADRNAGKTEGGRPVGSVYFRDVDMENRQAEYGIFIGEADARGKGYGNEAAYLALRWFFTEKKMNRAYLRVYTDNLPAFRSYEQAGFVAVAKDADVVSTDGTKADMYRMEVTEEKWRAHCDNGRYALPCGNRPGSA